MLSPEMRKIVGSMKRIMTIIWGAFVTSVLIYCYVASIMVRGRTGEVEPPAGLLIAFTVVTILLIAGSFTARRIMLAEDRLRGILTGERPPLGNPDPSVKDGLPSAAELAALPESEQRLPHLLRHYQTVMVICLALVEAPVVLGFVLVILGHPWSTMLPFAAVTVIFAVPRFPRPEAFLEERSRLAYTR